VPVRAFLHGFGGGLGLAAFIAVMLLIGLDRATSAMTADAWRINRKLATAMASAVVALFLTVGLISAEPLAEETPISVGTMALDKIAELSNTDAVRLVSGNASPVATGQTPDAVTKDHEAIFRGFVQFSSRAALEAHGAARPEHINAGRMNGRGQRVRAEPASTGAHFLAQLFPATAGRPPHPHRGGPGDRTLRQLSPPAATSVSR
jgi:hypothetical protein